MYVAGDAYTERAIGRAAGADSMRPTIRQTATVSSAWCDRGFDLLGKVVPVAHRHV